MENLVFRARILFNNPAIRKAQVGDSVAGRVLFVVAVANCNQVAGRAATRKDHFSNCV